MPFKKANSPFFRVRRKNLPGYGDTGTLSTRTTNKNLARAMEALLEEIAESAYTDRRFRALLDALRPAAPGKPPRLTLPELLAAKNENRLRDLVSRLQDPPLRQAISEYAPLVDDRRILRGLRLLGELVDDPAATLGLLRSSKTITTLLHEAQRGGRRRNSVRRSLFQAISNLLRFHLGSAARNAVFADVDFPAEDDARDVMLAPDEIARLMRACQDVGREMAGPTSRGRTIAPPVFPALIHLALVTGADRGVLLRLKKRDVQIIAPITGATTGDLSGVVFLPDKKTRTRKRSLSLSASTCHLLMPILAGIESEDAVFDMTSDQVNQRWRAARERADLPAFRFKDLRHLFGAYGDRAGLSLSQLAGAMGHANRGTTMRYAVHTASLSVDAATAVEEAMGLSQRPEPMRLVSGEMG